ncbi:MAG TPA: heparinase II/III-family protein, partial [Longimicrobium sp.]|nr:heparinase II/III-family protein [Longimicrobium sp.]
GDSFRAYARSTRAHNTVEVAGREQSEVWSTFRVGGMARVRALETPPPGGAFRLAGECRPWWDARVAHRRVVGRVEGGRWRVEDRVEGAPGAPLRAYFHFAPEFEVRVEDGGFVAVSPAVTVRGTAWGADRMRVARGERAPDQGWYFVRFGPGVPAPVLILEIDHNDGRGFGVELAAEVS